MLVYPPLSHPLPPPAPPLPPVQRSFIHRFLLQFAGFRERLLVDNLFLTKVGA